MQQNGQPVKRPGVLNSQMAIVVIAIFSIILAIISGVSSYEYALSAIEAIVYLGVNVLSVALILIFAVVGYKAPSGTWLVVISFIIRVIQQVVSLIISAGAVVLVLNELSTVDFEALLQTEEGIMEFSSVIGGVVGGLIGTLVSTILWGVAASSAAKGFKSKGVITILAVISIIGGVFSLFGIVSGAFIYILSSSAYAILLGVLLLLLCNNAIYPLGKTAEEAEAEADAQAVASAQYVAGQYPYPAQGQGWNGQYPPQYPPQYPAQYPNQYPPQYPAQGWNGQQSQYPAQGQGWGQQPQYPAPQAQQRPAGVRNTGVGTATRRPASAQSTNATPASESAVSETPTANPTAKRTTTRSATGTKSTATKPAGTRSATSKSTSAKPAGPTLKALKEQLDAGLITQEEYNARVAERRNKTKK